VDGAKGFVPLWYPTVVLCVVWRKQVSNACDVMPECTGYLLLLIFRVHLDGCRLAARLAR
jgi:hypothetical protein